MATNRYSFTAVDSSKGVFAGGDPVVKCGQLLDNRMQCTKAGEFWVKDAEHPTAAQFQVCKRHAVVLESQGSSWTPIIKK